MTREEIEKTTKGILAEINNKSNLLITFGGIKQGLGIPVFEFFNSIADMDCDKVFLRDYAQAWYQKGIDTEVNNIDKLIEFLRTLIAANNYKRVCFIGNSMGGYAAILFGSILNVDKVIAFSPQTYIDRWNRLINLDFRWRRKITKIYKFKEKMPVYFDLKKHLESGIQYDTEINIYYSANHMLDRKHVNRLRNSKNVLLHPISEGGHGVVKVIRDNGELKNLILSTFSID